MLKRLFNIFLLGMFASALVACSPGSAPQRIAVFPRSSAISQPASPPQEVVYNAFLSLEVADPEWAAGEALSLAYRFGGCQVSSQLWEKYGVRYTVQVLCVPSYRYGEFRNELMRLGRVIDEYTSSSLVEVFGASGRAYSQITVQFQTSPQYISEPYIPGWNPTHTLKKAFLVFFNVFRFLADILIWLLVVIGPFALLGWGVWRLARRKSSLRG